MGGLIPLLLPSGSRTSIMLDSIPENQPPTASKHRRQSSLPSQRYAQRFSLTPAPSNPMLPSSPGEWRKAIHEVKQKYASRRYRACSSRCLEILDNLRDPSGVDPVYTIYLEFYAASSSEMCARQLGTTSSFRTKLLRDARDHYERATHLIKSAENDLMRKAQSTPISSASSDASCHSPAQSVSSGASVADTDISTPRNSIGSADDLESKAQRVRRPKKKVSFSGLPDLPEDWNPVPLIRPDSPTLGWDDSSLGQPSEFSLNHSVPVVEAKPEPEPKLYEPSHPRDLPKKPCLRVDTTVAPVEAPVEDKFDLAAFLETRSMTRFCDSLSSLRSQVNWHRDAVNTLLSTPEEQTPPVPALPTSLTAAFPSPPKSAPETTASPAASPLRLTELDLPASRRSIMLSNSPAYFDLSTRSSSAMSNSRPGSRLARSNSSASMQDTVEEIREKSADIKARIERLRATGWQRKRFNAGRYEALREQVLCELGA